jgi:hypothetical protein
MPAAFIHIQSTYTDRIQFQEYFLQASTKLQKVRNPVDFMRTLQKSMSHAMRLKTLLPYESVVAFAYALRERCSRPSYMGRPHRLTRRTIQLYRRPASMDGESSARKSG